MAGTLAAPVGMTGMTTTRGGLKQDGFMKQFERYILRRMALLTFWSLVSATLLVLTTQVLLRLNILTSSNQALVAFLKVSGFLIPNVIVIVAPFALLIGVSQVLYGLNSDSELVVMESSGAGPAIIYRPVLILSAAVSLLTFSVGNLIEPYSNRALGDTIAEASADLLSVAVRTGSFQKLDDNLFVHISKTFPGGEFGGIFLSDRRTPEREIVYFAERGRMVQVGENRFLVLADGQAQQQEQENRQISIVKFDSYALDLSSFLPTGNRSIFKPREQTTPYLLDPPKDDFFHVRFPNEITKQLVDRLTAWNYPLLFGLICCVFMGRAHSNRQDQLQSILTVVGLVMAFRGFGFYSAEEAGHSTGMKIAAYGVPAGGILLYLWLTMAGLQPHMPKWLVHLRDLGITRILELFERAYGWHLQRTRRKTGQA